MFQARETNRRLVQIEYFGYLRRNPNDPPDGNFNGYNFWVAKLNQFNGDVFWLGKLNSFNGDPFQAEMVRSFIRAPEYRSRSGQP
jgi:hypothetical protein